MSSESARTRYSAGEVAAVVALTILAAAIRYFRLADWPFYGDELLTRYHIEVWHPKRIPYSPLFYLPIAGTMRLFGNTELGLRMVPFLTGVAMIPAMWAVARRLGGRTMALWAAAFAALAPWHVAQSQNARYYPLQALLALAATYFVLRAVENGRLRDYVATVVIAAAAIAVRASSLYLVVSTIGFLGLVIVWPAIRPAGYSPRKTIAFAGVLAVLAFAATRIGVEMYRDTGGWGRSPLHVLFTAGYYHTLAALAVAGVVALYGLATRNRLLVLFGCFAFGPIALVAATALVRVAVGQVTFMALPAIVLLCAWPIARLAETSAPRERWLAFALGLALLGEFAMRDAEYFMAANGYRPRFDDAARFVAANIRPGDRVFANTLGIQSTLQERYLPPGMAVAFSDGIPAKADISRAGGRAWFVMEDAFSTWNVSSPATAWIERDARLVAAFPGSVGPRSRTLRIYLYAPSPER